jgi:DNA processing protein
MNESLKYWLAINKIPNLGPVTIKKLWEHYGSIQAVWNADEKNIWKIEGLSKPAVKAFINNRNKVDLNAEIKAIEKTEVKVLTIEDEDYPTGLKNIYDPPPVLFIKGKILRSDEKALAIVGTRKASRYGLEMARKLASDLSSLGITIISGLAAGIDTAAHRGALEAKGRTIAVFGCGINVIFPAANRDLAKEIERTGALVSEFPVGAGTDKVNFPRRNRVISGLSLGVIMVEGHYDSGAMITAKAALDQGREVFAVPGNVQLDQSKGPHWLIKQGAKLVESVEDVLDELKSQIPISKSQTIPKSQIPMTKRDYSDLSQDEQKIVSVLSLEPKHLDVISMETKLSIPQVSSTLMMLEIKKVVRQLPGKNFVLS